MSQGLRRPTARALRATKITAFIGAALVASLVLSACNVSPPAARVDGSPITISQLQSAVSAVSKDAGYRCQLVQGLDSAYGEGIKGAGKGTYSMHLVDEVLSDLVVEKVLQLAAAKEGIHVTARDLELARPQVESSLQPSSSTPSACDEPGSEVYAAFSPSYRHGLLVEQAEAELLVAKNRGIAVGSSALHAYFLKHRRGLATTCVQVIVVSHKSEASTLIGDLAKGQSFSALAKADSLDSSTAANGGRLPCVAPALSFSPSLAKAVQAIGVGKVGAPLSYEGAWLVLKVDKRTPAIYGPALASQIRARLLSSSSTDKAASALFDHLIAKAHVYVNPRYGHWAGLHAQPPIQPPLLPPASDMIDANANHPPAPSASGS